MPLVSESLAVHSGNVMPLLAESACRRSGICNNIYRFDMKFIQRDSERYFGKTVDNNIIDTLQLSRKYIPKLCSHSLGALANYYEVSYEGAHRALADCKINFLVYKCLLEEMKKAIKTVQADEICPRCGNALVKRNGKRGRFWGCESFPVCKYTRDFNCSS